MPEQANLVSRRWLYIPFSAAAVILFGYYILWSSAAREIERTIDKWAAEQRAAGFDVSYGAINAHGFPFFLRIHIDDPDVAAPGVWRWRCGGLFIDSLPYDLSRLIFTPEGEQVLMTARYGEWRATAEELRSSFAYDAAHGWKYSMNVAGYAGANRDIAARITLGSLVYDLAPDANDPYTLTLTLALENFAYVGASGEKLEIDEMRSVLALTHIPALLAFDPAATWRAGGGALEIRGFYADIEHAAFSVGGEIGLDEKLRPAGALETKIRNPAGLARLLRKAGALTLKEAEIAEAQLNLLAIAGGGEIAAPIEIENGAATIGGVKLADLPQFGISDQP